MCVSRPRVLFAAVTLALVIASLGWTVPAANAQDDASRFADLLAARADTVRLTGPFAGEIIQEDGFSMTVAAGLATESFSAGVTVLNPDDTAGAPWDFGFTFHQTPDVAQQIVIDSDGVWYYSPFPDGTLDSGFVPEFDATPGGENRIDLIVDGTTALLGVNGSFVASIALPPPIASDVQIGSGYFDANTVGGRAITYIDFEVWPYPEMDAATESTTAGTRPSVGTPDASAPPAPTPQAFTAEEVAVFATVLAAQSQAPPLAGPFNANLTEEDGRISLSWADVELADFHARAVFDVPSTVSGISWDIGFMFRTGAGGTLRVVVDSRGNWYSSQGTDAPAAIGVVDGIVNAEGEANALDLLVADETAVLGINGNLAAVIDLAPDSAAADVAAGAGFYSDQTVPGRVIPFRDFVVLPFDPDAVTSVAPDAAADAAAFVNFVTETEQVVPMAGPFAGRLVESDSGTVPLAAAGVTLADFAAVATFVNPDDFDSASWDAGFQFRGDAEATHRIAVRSSGEIHLVDPEGSSRIVGVAAAYDPTPGARNTLQLFVEDDRALAGVNGAYVGTVTLDAAPLSADVQAGAAFFGDDFVQDRVTAYEGFSIWEIT